MCIMFKYFSIYQGGVMFNETCSYKIIFRIVKTLFDLSQITFPLTGFFWERKVIENSTSRVSIQFIGLNYTTNGTNNLEGKINITVIIIVSHLNNGFIQIDCRGKLLITLRRVLSLP